MKSKLLFALLIFFVIGCADKKKTSSPLLDYIPQNASAIFKINDLESFKDELSTNDFLKAINNFKVYKTVSKKIETLSHLALGSEGVLSFHELGKENFEFTFVTHATPGLFQLDSLKNKTIETIIYEGKSFDKYEIEDSLLYSTKTDGKIIISSSQVLLENFIRHQNEPKLSEALQKLYNASNDSKSASVFLNLNRSNGLLNSCLEEYTKINASEFSDWVSVDFSADTHYLQLNGVSIANDSLKNFVNLFRGTSPLTNTTPSFAPMHSDAIVSYSFDDYAIFAKNQQWYLDRSTPMDSLFNTTEEIGFITLNGQNALVINTYGSENILDYLSSVKTRSYAYQGNEIFELGTDAFLQNALQPIVVDFKAKYSSILENAFVFTEAKETLQTIISNYKNGSTFEKTPVYSAAKASMASESTMLYLSNSSGIEAVLENDFEKEFQNDFKKAKLSEYAFGMQLVADDGFFHLNAVVQKAGKTTKTKSVSPLFNVQLDNEVMTRPQFVINHRTNKKEIVVQDQANILYLISTKGKILWKKQMEGPIQGKIKQVDIYKNGRLQLAFTTDNQFLILDRNGKEVSPFNMSYGGGNLNPLAVFDYDGKKDYRFVVTQGEQVFMYNSKGKIVEGFKYTRAEKPILGAPKHFRVGNKDFISFKLVGGSLKIMNRIGNVRTDVREKIDFSENEVYLHKGKFTLTDQKGALHQIDQKGKITKTHFNLEKDHGFDATGKSLVLMNDNILNIKGRKVQLDLGVYSKPKIFYIYDKIYVSVTDIQNQKVYLYDSLAKPIPHFPIFGTSAIDLADIDNDRNLELVTKDRPNALVVYKIN